ncbi:MAG: DUF115 domain-containing protein [Gammaproteobacteria bacterium]|nr:DUF115 domain-containing protein [Gammaproteobacteria bacterium]
MTTSTVSTNNSMAHFFTNQFGDEFLYEVNGSVFNTVGAEVTFDKYFLNTYFNEDSLYMIVGSDSGLLIKYIQKKGIPNGSKYLFIEPDDIYENLKLHININDLDDRIQLCTYADWLQTATQMSLDKYIYTSSAHLAKSMAAKDVLYAPYIDLYVATEEQFGNHSRNIANSVQLRTFIDRQLDNLADNHSPFIQLRDTYKGKTCVIIAGGPSLDENIDWIKENQTNLIIIAVSRVAKKLIKENIKPDIIVTVDPKHGSFDVGKEAMTFWQDSLLIQSYHADNYLAAQWRGKAVYLGLRCPWQSELNIENISAAGPTVTQSSVLCAVEMGFENIILCGVDNCYSKDGFTHSKGSIETDSGPLLSTIGTTVETNGGRMAETILDLKLGIIAIERIIQASRNSNKNFRVFNPSINAAKISGVEFLTTAEIEKPSELSQQEKQVHLKLSGLDNSKKSSDLLAVDKELGAILKEIREIQKLSHEAIKQNKLAHKNLDMGSKKKLDKIENKINTKFKKANAFIMNYNAVDFLQRAIADHDREFSMEDIEKRVDTLFKTYADSSKFLIERLTACKTQIASRISELSETPQLDIIFEQWTTDNTPGRAYIFEDNRPANIPEKYQAKLADFKKQYDELLQSDSSAFLDLLIESRKNHTSPKSKADLLFGRKDLVRLKQLSHGLLFHKNDPEWFAITTLVNGYISELEENYEDALGIYNEIIESNYQLDVLKRILHISVMQQDNDTALLALDCLSAAAPIYMPIYAEMQSLTGNNLDAINTYTEYLKLVPDDISSWLKLGKLYLDLDIKSSAEWVFQQVLDISPENPSAIKYLNDILERE